MPYESISCQKHLHGVKRSLAQIAALTLVQFATETLLDKVVQTVAQRFKFHLVDDLIDESELQEQLGFLLTDAALLHIEHGRIVQLPHR